MFFHTIPIGFEIQFATGAVHVVPAEEISNGPAAKTVGDLGRECIEALLAAFFKVMKNSDVEVLGMIWPLATVSLSVPGSRFHAPIFPTFEDAAPPIGNVLLSDVCVP